MKTILNLINGQLVAPASNTYIDNYDPSTGSVYSLIPDSDKRDVEQAVAAAKSAFPAWRDMPKEKRSAILIKLSELIQRDLDKLALAESIDNGKPLWLSKSVDIPRAVSNIHFYATAALHMHDEAYARGTVAMNYTMRTTLGIAGCISPWNLPLYLFTWKIAPALASG